MNYVHGCECGCFGGFVRIASGVQRGHVTAYVALDYGGVRSVWLGSIEFSLLWIYFPV